MVNVAVSSNSRLVTTGSYSAVSFNASVSAVCVLFLATAIKLLLIACFVVSELTTLPIKSFGSLMKSSKLLLESIVLFVDPESSVVLKICSASLTSITIA